MTGTPAQVEWAERIKRNVNAEFDRMAAALGTMPNKPDDQQRADVAAILEILEENREEVLGNTEAGYFIKHWQELRIQASPQRRRRRWRRFAWTWPTESPSPARQQT